MRRDDHPKQQIKVAQMAPKRVASSLPFSVWMALAKATPVRPALSNAAQTSLLHRH
jgi:hypothetical protein